MPTVFFSFSHADISLRDQLEKQLSVLKRQGIIDAWHDRLVPAGGDFAQEIDDHINSDEIILLLVSSDFLASDYCYQIEMQRALERHERKEAIVIPVILRACDWKNSVFGKLKGVPEDGRPITQWPDIDAAMLEVTHAVRAAATRTGSKSTTPTLPTGKNIEVQQPQAVSAPRSSNLSLPKQFTQRDKDDYKLETFEYVAPFFENSLVELTERNPGYEGTFRRVDANRFFATIYRHGKDVSRCTVYIGGGSFDNGINYVQGETTSSSTMNESLSVQADDQSLFIQAMGMSMMGTSRDQKLSQEGGAELFWDILIRPLKSNQH